MPVIDPLTPQEEIILSAQPVPFTSPSGTNVGDTGGGAAGGAGGGVGTGDVPHGGSGGGGGGGGAGTGDVPHGGGSTPITPPLGEGPTSVGIGVPGGSVVIVSHLDGDLGSTEVTVNTFLLRKEASKRLSNQVTPLTFNHRFRGHRESNKFNHFIQSILLTCVNLAQSLYNWDVRLKVSEASLYPTGAELAYLNHIADQISFKEWLLLKDVDRRWYLK